MITSPLKKRKCQLVTETAKTIWYITLLKRYKAQMEIGKAINLKHLMIHFDNSEKPEGN